MKYLIDRREVIKALSELATQTKVKTQKYAIGDCVEIIERIPGIPCDDPGDTISRQAALEEIDRVRKELVAQGMVGAEHILVHYGRRIIEELPTIYLEGEEKNEENWYDYRDEERFERWTT